MYLLEDESEKYTLKGMKKYSNRFMEYRIPLRKVVKKIKNPLSNVNLTRGFW